MLFMINTVEIVNYQIISNKLAGSADYEKQVALWTTTIEEKCPGTNFSGAFYAKSGI